MKMYRNAQQHRKDAILQFLYNVLLSVLNPVYSGYSNKCERRECSHLFTVFET